MLFIQLKNNNKIFNATAQINYFIMFHSVLTYGILDCSNVSHTNVERVFILEKEQYIDLYIIKL